MATAHGKLHKQQQLTAHAHRMRIAPSEPERVLWQALRSSQLGVQFRRQVVLRGYIVDFFAPAAALVVEVDGAHHTRQRGADTRRNAHWRKQGSRSCDCRRRSSSATCRRHYKPSCRRCGAKRSCR